MFTIGRGNDVQCAAIAALARSSSGSIDEPGDIADLSHALVHDSQLRWLGPEKGVSHMAIGSVVNAAGTWSAPSWRSGVAARLEPPVDELLAQVDFRYLTDALTPDEARDILEAAEPGRGRPNRAAAGRGLSGLHDVAGMARLQRRQDGRLAREAVGAGFAAIKLKVGGNRDDDVRRMRLARDTVGADYPIAIDANQRWGVAEAVDWLEALAPMNRGGSRNRRAPTTCSPTRRSAAPSPDAGRHR